MFDRGIIENRKSLLKEEMEFKFCNQTVMTLIFRLMFRICITHYSVFSFMFDSNEQSIFSAAIIIFCWTYLFKPWY